MENNIVYSYPLELERILKKHNKDIEVNNFTQGGYNSADLLVSFVLQNIETRPDYIIIYHAYNDKILLNQGQDLVQIILTAEKIFG